MSDRQEWERDAVVWLAGRVIEAAIGGTTDGTARPPDDPRLVRAMARFAVWRTEAGREADAARFAERVRRTMAAGRSVRRIDHAPELVRPDAPGPLAAMFTAARHRSAAPLAELGVAAGTGRELFDEPCEAWVALPDGLPAARYVALRVVGDSMTPLMHSGDVVLVDLDAAVPPGAIAVVQHPDHGSVVKRALRADGGALRLVSLNPAYPPLVLPPGAGSLLGPVVVRWCAHPGVADRPAKPRLAPRP
jgi:SOS-response transcriptional repressor LexA